MDASTLSDSFARIVSTTSASVVGVDGGRRFPSAGAVWADGIIVTAAHTLERDTDLEVRLPDGKDVPATLVGADAATDVAVLRVATAGLTAAPWGGDDALAVGHLVLGVGRGRGVRASLGIVRSLGDAWRTAEGGRIDRWIETGLGPWPGFSGSLLVDATGRALGINTSGLSRHHSLVVPATTLRRVVGDLVAHGRTRRAWLGLGTYPVRLPPKTAAEVGQDTALVVVSVQPDGPAERGGVVLGDTILALDGQRVGRPDELVALLDGNRIGTAATLRLLRAGAPLDLSLTLGARE